MKDESFIHGFVPARCWTQSLLCAISRAEMENNMEKNIVLSVKKYLEDTGIIDIDNEVSKMDLRAQGKEFSLSEHIEGMVYSLLSAQTVYQLVAPVKSRAAAIELLNRKGYGNPKRIIGKRVILIHGKRFVIFR